MKQLEVDPEVYTYDDERVRKLQKGEVTPQQFMRSTLPQDPFVVDKRVIRLATTEVLGQIQERYTRAMEDRLTKTGGAKPVEVFDNREQLFKVYPELATQYADLEEELKGCTNCSKRKYGRQILDSVLQISYDGRDLSSLENFLPEDTIKILKGEEIERKSVSPRLPPFLQKKKAIDKPSREKLIENPNKIEREPCVDCVRKHVAQAIILLREVKQGYASDFHVHKWLAVGHLAEAADEALGYDEALAQKIRTIRLELMRQIDDV